MIELYGADYSVYVRSARMALIEKGIAYELVPIDVFAPGGPPESSEPTPDDGERPPMGPSM